MIIYLFIFIFIFIIYLYRPNQNKEHFYTLFNPFIENIKDLEYKFKKTNDLTMLISKHDNIDFHTFKLYFLKLLISNSHDSFDTILNYKYNDKEIIQKIYENKFITNISMPVFNYYNQQQELENIKFLFNSNNEFIIPITNKRNIMKSLNTINNDFSIVIDFEYSSTHIFLISLFRYLNKKVKYIFKINMKDILDSIYNNEYQLCFISTVFPSKRFTDYMENKGDNLRIIDYENLNLRNYLNININFELKDFNLSNVSKSFLPTKINNEVYTIYKPFIKLINFKYAFIANQNLNNELIYNLVKNYYEIIPILNRNLYEFKSNKLSAIDSANTYSNNILLHDGALKYYLEKGFITYNENLNCKKFVSKLKCNNKTLSDYNLNLT